MTEDDEAIEVRRTVTELRERVRNLEAREARATTLPGTDDLRVGDFLELERRLVVIESKIDQLLARQRDR
jgi:hypothetical protein